MNDKLKEALYDEAQMNGFNVNEYHILLKQANELLDFLTAGTKESREGVIPDLNYDVNGNKGL